MFDSERNDPSVPVSSRSSIVIVLPAEGKAKGGQGVCHRAWWRGGASRDVCATVNVGTPPSRAITI
jgi:hypothetical protein